jgi:transcriptional regulator with XRE-family HTH domain
VYLGLLSAEQIRNNREELGLTRRELAEQRGVAIETISRWENGVLTQTRAMDRYRRLYFGVPAARAALVNQSVNMQDCSSLLRRPTKLATKGISLHNVESSGFRGGSHALRLLRRAWLVGSRDRHAPIQSSTFNPGTFWKSTRFRVSTVSRTASISMFPVATGNSSRLRSESSLCHYPILLYLRRCVGGTMIGGYQRRFNVRASPPTSRRRDDAWRLPTTSPTMHVTADLASAGRCLAATAPSRAS